MSQFSISTRFHDYSYSVELCRNLDTFQAQQFATEMLDKLLCDLGLPYGFRFPSDWQIPFGNLELLPRRVWRPWIAPANWLQHLMRRHHPYVRVTVEALSSLLEIALPPLPEITLPEGGAGLIVLFSLDSGHDIRQTRFIPLHVLSPGIRAELKRRFAAYLFALHKNHGIAAAPGLTK